MQDKIVKLLQELIRFKSVESNPEEIKGIVAYCKDFFGDGFHITEYEHNAKPSILIGTHEGSDFDVLMNGHLDVVDAEDHQFVPKIEDGMLYARGAIDMKGSVSVMMMVLKNIRSIRTDVRIGLLLTTDEEVGGPDGVGYVMGSHPIKARVVFVPDGGAIDKIVTSQKGVLRFRLDALGVPAHASSPWRGENAIDKLIACYYEIRTIFPNPTSDEQWDVTTNLGKIQAGESVNKVPEKCSAWLDMRYIETRSKQEWIDAITAICKKHEITCSVEIAADMSFTDEHNAYLQAFKDATESILGTPASFGRENGASDARYFSSKGIPVIMSNPVGGGFHNHVEYVELASLHDYYRIISLFLQGFATVEN